MRHNIVIKPNAHYGGTEFDLKTVFMTLCVALALFLCLGVSADDINVSAHAAALIDADSGRILWAKNADEQMSMASTTKIMTALVAIENADIKDEVVIPAKAVGVEGSSVCLKEGEILTLEELLYAMLLESANDAAAAIAIHVGGSIEDFALMMNERAGQMGLESTSFANPHGLDAVGHYTTARELGLIAAEALKNSDFAKMVSTYRHQIPFGKESRRYLLNHNKMLKLYDGAIGVKTGFTKKSGRCLVSAAERDGLRLVAVTLNAPNDWSDHRAMLDYGFENYEMREIVSEGEYSFKLSCVGGETPEITVSNTDGFKACMRKGDTDACVTVNLPRFVYAPISAGAPLGEAVISKNGEVLGKVELISSDESKQKIYTRQFLWF